jgi:hypothetical protein
MSKAELGVALVTGHPAESDGQSPGAAARRLLRVRDQP